MVKQHPLRRRRGVWRGVSLACCLWPLLGHVAQAQDSFDFPKCSEKVSEDFLTGRRSAIGQSTLYFPAIGVPSSVEIGESMVSAAELSAVITGVTLSQPLVIHGSMLRIAYDITVPPGVLREETASSGIIYRPAMTIFKLEKESKPKNVGPEVWLTIDPSDITRFYSHAKFGKIYKSSTIDNVKFESKICSSVGPKGFRRELVYSGISKGVVSILYREFSGDMARPAFSQVLSYDLGDGGEIGFRGARFKITKATNIRIDYVVIKPLQ